MIRPTVVEVNGRPLSWAYTAVIRGDAGAVPVGGEIIADGAWHQARDCHGDTCIEYRYDVQTRAIIWVDHARHRDGGWVPDDITVAPEDQDALGAELAVRIRSRGLAAPEPEPAPVVDDDPAETLDPELVARLRKRFAKYGGRAKDAPAREPEAATLDPATLDPALVVTLFADEHAFRKQEKPMTWDELVAKVEKPKRYVTKAKMPFVKLATFGEARTDAKSLRHDANVVAITGIEGDYDGEIMPLADAATELAARGIRAVLYSSPSSTPDKPRWRVLCPLSHEYPPARRREFVGRLNRILGGSLASESFTLSQSYYIGHADDAAHYVMQQVRGERCIDQADDVEPFYPANGAETGPANPEPDDDLRKAILEGIEGHVYQAVLSLTARLVGRSMAPGDVVAVLQGLLDQCEWKARDPKTWQERYDAVPRMVASAVKKFGPRKRDDEPGRGDDHRDDDDRVPAGETGLDLMGRDMPAIAFNCEPWIPEGLGLTAGRPKLGKSTLARQKLAAVASGGQFFDATCRQSKCLYLALEENARQTRHKLELAAFPREALANIVFFFEWPRGTDGVLQLARFLDRDPAIKYATIDSLTRFRSIPDQRTPAFVADYEAISALQGLCKDRPGLTIEVVHHTRKMKGDDPLEDISGTFGLSAACDWYGVMRYHEDGAVLHVGGRLWDRDVTQYELRRANQRWELVGEFTGLSQAQRDTLRHLLMSGGQTPTEAARFWSISKQGAQQRMESLVALGVATCKEGTYRAKNT